MTRGKDHGQMLFVRYAGEESKARFIGIIEGRLLGRLDYHRGRVYNIIVNVIKDGKEYEELVRVSSKPEEVEVFVVGIKNHNINTKDKYIRGGYVTGLNFEETGSVDVTVNFEITRDILVSILVGDLRDFIENVETFRDRYKGYVDKLTDKVDVLDKQYWDNKRDIERLKEQKKGLVDILVKEDENRILVINIEELIGVIDLYKGYIDKIDIYKR